MDNLDMIAESKTYCKVKSRLKISRKNWITDGLIKSYCTKNKDFITKL